MNDPYGWHAHLAKFVGGWIHQDGTPCPEYLAPVDSAPESGWWCTTHQMFVFMPEDRQSV